MSEQFAAVAPAPRSVLLVDDDDGNRLVLSVLLEDHGFEVCTVSSLAAARASITPPGAPYEVVLLDLHLGDGLGTDLVPLIRARLPDAKIVLISGSVGDGAEDCAGLDAVACKGIVFPDLLALMERVTHA